MSADEKKDRMTRRQFIKASTVSAVGTVVLTKVPLLSGETSDKDLRDHSRKQLLSLTVNDKPVRLLVEPRETLAEILRERLKLTGTKITCNRGQCGACTVLLNGKAVYSCHMLALDAAGGSVTTIEGLMSGEKLHPLQQAFVEHDGLQCGFCTPGQIMSSEALLQKHPKPTKTQVLEALSGNLCRCAAYPKIVDSVLGAGK